MWHQSQLLHEPNHQEQPAFGRAQASHWDSSELCSNSQIGHWRLWKETHRGRARAHDSLCLKRLWHFGAPWTHWAKDQRLAYPSLGCQCSQEQKSNCHWRRRYSKGSLCTLRWKCWWSPWPGPFGSPISPCHSVPLYNVCNYFLRDKEEHIY